MNGEKVTSEKKERKNQLIVRGLCVNFNGFVAVDNVDLTVEPGETRVIIGPNGAGKTTTFRMIMNLLEPTSGKITLNGKKIDYNIKVS